MVEAGRWSRLLPRDLTGLPIERDQTRILWVGTIRQHEHGFLIENRTGADGHVPGIGSDFFSPEDVAAEVESDQLGGTEERINSLAIGAGGGSTVAAAQILQQPRAGWNFDVPHGLAVVRAIAGDVMLGELRLCDSLRPVNHDQEDSILPDNRAGLIVIELRLAIRTRQRHRPNDVRPVLATPGERQVSGVGDSHPRGTAPARPVTGTGGPGQQEQHRNRQ